MKILVVEDDEICAKVLKTALTKYGQIDIAEDGVIGLAAVEEALDQKEPYDLICLDIMMPNMDGHETLPLIREKELKHGFYIGQGSKILMTTAISDHRNIIESFKEDCDGYIVKPVSIANLDKKLKEIGLT